MKAITRGAVGSLALIVVLAVAAAPAFAASQTWSPLSTKVVLSGTNTSFTTPGGFISVTCPTSSVTGTTQATAQSSVTTAAANVVFGPKCTATGNVPALVVTSGTWGLTLSDATTVGSGGGATATCGKAAPNDSCAVTVHVGGAVVTVTAGLLGSCTLTVGAQSVAGTVTDTNTSLVVNDNTLSYASSGGVCGSSAATANFTGTYTSSPAVTVTLV